MESCGTIQKILQLDLVLPGPQEEVQTRSERIGLHPRLAVESHDLAFGQCAALPQHGIALVHDANAALGNQNDAKQPQYQAIASNHKNGCDHPPNPDHVVENTRQWHCFSSNNESQNLSERY